MATLTPFAFKDQFSSESFFVCMTVEDYQVRYRAQVSQPHTHTYYLILFITQGSGSHLIDFTEYPIVPDSLYCLVPGQVQQLNGLKDTRGYVLVFEDYFYCSGNEPTAIPLTPPFFRNGLVNPHFLLPTEMVDLVTGIFQRLAGEYEEQWSGKWELIRTLLHLLFHRLAALADSLISPLASPVNRSWVLASDFKKLVEAHFAQQKSLGFYADRLFVSPNHLTETVRERTGETPLAMIRKRTLLEAKRRLLKNDASVKEIAYRLGYQSSSYFIRIFRQETGLTPAAFRAKVKAPDTDA